MHPFLTKICLHGTKTLMEGYALCMPCFIVSPNFKFKCVKFAISGMVGEQNDQELLQHLRTLNSKDEK